MNSKIKQQENIIVIDGGTIAGKNLFHSLNDLSVPSNNAVNFNNSSDVDSIFIKVIGESISSINGLIKANGTANLFFINPNGITFGKNASLDIGGSFFATTASKIKFADGFEFSATDSSNSSVSIDVPIGMGFTGDTMGIEVRGDSNLANQNQLLSPFTRGVEPSGISVKRGKTLGLVGGDLILNGATLAAEDGQIELGSVAGNSFVNLIQRNKRWTLLYEESSLKDIDLSQGTLVDTSGVTGGSIHVQGSNVRLTDGSVFLIQNLGTQQNENLKVNATESLELVGDIPSGRIVSSLRTSTVAVKDQNFANKLSEADDFSIGKAADIVVNSKHVSLQKGATIGSVTNNTANGGNVILKAAESIFISGFLPLGRNSNIFAVTTKNSSGKAGNITISTGFLSAKDGGYVGSSSTGSGSGGILMIDASNAVELSSPRSYLATRAFSTGSAGKLIINTPKLIAKDGARVHTSTLASGSAGSITIDANFVELSGAGKASGRIIPSSINSAANIPTPDIQKIFRTPAIPDGKSGDVKINAKKLKITNTAEVSVKNEGTGDAGILRINADIINLDNSSSITATSTSGKGGIIEINSAEIFVSPDSQINASSKTGIDGTVQINLPDTTN